MLSEGIPIKDELEWSLKAEEILAGELEGITMRRQELEEELEEE